MAFQTVVKLSIFLYIIGGSSGQDAEQNGPTGPLYSASECEPEMFMSDKSNFCWYHVCDVKGGNFKTVPFACPAGSVVPTDYTKGFKTPCSVHDRSKLHKNCTVKAAEIRICDRIRLFQCDYDRCHAERTCIDFEDAPECARTCMNDYCPGYEVEEIFGPCGSKDRSVLLSACVRGCYKNLFVQSGVVDLKWEASFDSFSACYDQCYISACAPLPADC